MDDREKIAELKAYKLRERDIEDMELKIKELELGDNLGSPGFDEKVQTSMSCKNNDYNMNQIESLKKKIERKKIANKKVDSALKRLDIPLNARTREIEKEDIKVITKVYIENKSITRTAQELYRTRKSIKKAMERGIAKLKIY